MRNGRSLFPLLLYAVLFSIIKLELENRSLTAVHQHDSTTFVNNNYNGVSRSLTGFVRRGESSTISRTSNDDDSAIVQQNEMKTRSELCHKIVGDTESSFQRVWERMRTSITKVSLINTDWTKDIRSMKNFTDWVDESMSYFTYSRLQHTSISRPIDQSQSIGRIHSILEAKMTSPTTAPPLRIVVFGGSVTNGHYCLDNIFDFFVRNDGKGNDRAGTPAHQSKICAWSGRLQDMMDVTFGSGVVDIKNLAVGGAKSDMSTALMEFGLIPDSTPDIIIWDHGINDAMTTVDPNVKYYESSGLDTEQIFEKLQKFYQAAMALPTSSCDNPDPPLLILLDSLIGQQVRFPQISEALRTSTAVSKMLTWYPNIWGISSANTIRPYVLTKVSNEKKMIRLLGSNSVTTHPGMMYHISIAWIIMFNFVNALHDNCVTRDIIGTASPLLSSESSNNPFSVDESEDLPLSHLPELHEKLLMVDVPEVWKERIPAPFDQNACLAQQVAKTKASNNNKNKDTSLTCFYAWIVNSVLKVETPAQVDKKMKPYIVQNKGWSAYDKKDPSIKPGGWIPMNGHGSYFEMKFSDVPITVNTLTIIYMQSYGKLWNNSTLQIDAVFYNNPTSSSTTTKVNTDNMMNISHIIHGYHDEETSILVPIKLPLPDRTTIINIEDNEEKSMMLRLHFRLLNGQTFKIAGMALC